MSMKVSESDQRRGTERLEFLLSFFFDSLEIFISVFTIINLIIIILTLIIELIAISSY